MTETTTETVRRLMAVVGRVKLDASPDFWKAPMSTLVECYNGTGPEWFPQGLRHVLDEVLELALPAVLIHDFDYSYNDGSLAQFEAANSRLYKNIRKLVSDSYPLTDFMLIIPRLRWEFRAWILYKSCCDLGWCAYERGTK